MLVQTPTEKRLFFRILGIPRPALFLPCASLHYKFPTDSFPFRKQRDCFGLASRTGVIVAESFVDDAFEVSLAVCFSSFILPVFQLTQLWPFAASLPSHSSSALAHAVVAASLPSDSPCVPAHPVVAWLSLFPQTLRVFQHIQLWPASLPSDSPIVPGYPVVACFSSFRLVQCSSSCTCGLPLFQCSSSFSCGLVASLPSDRPCVPGYPGVACLASF